MREACTSPDDRIDALALALAPSVGARNYRHRSERFGSAARAFAATVSPTEHARLRTEARELAASAARCRARLLLLHDADYPARLLDLDDPPPFLFAVGDLAVLQRPVVAIVGTRRASPYGERVTTAIAGTVAAAGACVVSGMARGIDAAAHRAALARGGATAAVLGTGVDVPYPVGHRSLHRTIGERGLVLSEFPCGAAPAPASFPRRNRIIAALARLTIVVEAGERSGASITAGLALDLGRDVAAVPGPIDAPQSARTNELIRQGAHPILSANDALMLLGLTGDATCHRDVAPTLRGDERAVWVALADGAVAVDELAERIALPPNRTMAAITGLELAGLVETLYTGEVKRRRG